MNPSSGPWDPGLQNERTTLAWSRTALSVVALGALIARQSGSIFFGGVLLVVVLVVAGTMVLHSDRRHRRRNQRLRSGAAVGALAEVVAATGVVLALAACGLVVTVT